MTKNIFYKLFERKRLPSMKDSNSQKQTQTIRDYE